MDELFHYEAKKTKHLVRVEVTDEKITFLAVNAAAWVFEADIKDIVGCHLMKNVSLNDPYLRIFYYPFDDRRTRRREIIVDLKPAGDKAYDDCLKIKLMILRASCGFPRDWSDYDTLKTIENLQKLIILINPKSGKGNARKTFTSKVVPLLSEANIGCDAVFTTGPNHARRLLKTMDLTVYRGIVVISGDGLLFEVINGLLEREDWETAIQVPLGIIPQGSGNGIARTLADAQNEPYHLDPVLTSTLNIIRARPKAVDLMRVLQRFPDESEKTYYAVLSVGYGLLADIDIESERLRSLGESRFTIWAVLRLIGLKTYRLKVSYLQAEPGDKGETQPQRLSPRLFRSTTEVEKPRNDELIRRTISADTNIISDPLEPFADNQIEYGDLAEDFVAADTFGPSSKYSPLTGEIPSDWVTIEGDFVLVYAVLQRFIGTDNMFAPKSKMDDGLIYLLLIRGDASRGQLFQFLTSFESGTHVDVPCCEMIPVKAFRLEPQTSEGNLTIDGEKVPTAPVQVEILPSFYRVFMR